jgi:hypothetical protein
VRMKSGSQDAFGPVPLDVANNLSVLSAHEAATPWVDAHASGRCACMSLRSHSAVALFDRIELSAGHSETKHDSFTSTE